MRSDGHNDFQLLSLDFQHFDDVFVGSYLHVHERRCSDRNHDLVSILGVHERRDGFVGQVDLVETAAENRDLAV